MVPATNVDPTKAQLNNIRDSLIHTFETCKKEPKFDPVPAIKAAVMEAYNIGAQVKTGQKEGIQPDEPVKVKTPPKAAHAPKKA